jgi:hypothetical protein
MQLLGPRQAVQVCDDTTHKLLLNAASLKRLSSGGEARSLPRYLVTSTFTETASLSRLAKHYKALHAAAHVEFNATLALKHASASNVEPFDSVIHLVSHPVVSIEALSRLSRVDLDQLLPQPFAAANQTALHYATVHWVAVNSLLEIFADTRVCIEDLGGDDIPGNISLLLKISRAPPHCCFPIPSIADLEGPP